MASSHRQLFRTYASVHLVPPVKIRCEPVLVKEPDAQLVLTIIGMLGEAALSVRDVSCATRSARVSVGWRLSHSDVVGGFS